jgi:hypothetical protein
MFKIHAPSDTVGLMANLSEQQLPEAGPGRQMFGDRYPHYLSWLDGQTWELDVADEIDEGNVNRFQAALHYQAKTMGLKLVSKTIYRDLEDGSKRRKLLIRAT